jgi:hypothetical protein
MGSDNQYERVEQTIVVRYRITVNVNILSNIAENLIIKISLKFHAKAKINEGNWI